MDREREKIAGLTLPRLQAERLRLETRVREATWNARLEGNRLRDGESAEVLIDGHKFPGREGDIVQLKRTYQALEQVEAWVDTAKALDAQNLAKLHTILTAGKRAKPSSYRSDPAVSAEMNALFDWLVQTGEPPALQAGMAHFAIIATQPFSASNAILGRLVADWLLASGGYPLLRYASLAEALAGDPATYPSAIAQPDTTAWLEFFTQRLAISYGEAARRVEQAAGATPQPPETEITLPRPDPRERRVLRLFETQTEITAKDVMRLLDLPPNPARQLLESWVQQGWLVRSGLRYRMSANFKQNLPQILDPDH